MGRLPEGAIEGMKASWEMSDSSQASIAGHVIAVGTVCSLLPCGCLHCLHRTVSRCGIETCVSLLGIGGCLQQVIGLRVYWILWVPQGVHAVLCTIVRLLPPLRLRCLMI